jgi:hypothetical protein
MSCKWTLVCLVIVQKSSVQLPVPGSSFSDRYSFHFLSALSCRAYPPFNWETQGFQKRNLWIPTTTNIWREKLSTPIKRQASVCALNTRPHTLRHFPAGHPSLLSPLQRGFYSLLNYSQLLSAHTPDLLPRNLSPNFLLSFLVNFLKRVAYLHRAQFYPPPSPCAC